MEVITSFSSTSTSTNDLNNDELTPPEVRTTTSLTAEASSTSATSAALHPPKTKTEKSSSAIGPVSTSSKTHADAVREVKMEFEMVFDEIIAHAENQTVANKNKSCTQNSNMSVKQHKVKQELKKELKQEQIHNNTESPAEADPTDYGNGLNGVCEGSNSMSSTNSAADGKQRRRIPEIPLIPIRGAELRDPRRQPTPPKPLYFFHRLKQNRLEPKEPLELRRTVFEGYYGNTTPSTSTPTSAEFSPQSTPKMDPRIKNGRVASTTGTTATATGASEASSKLQNLNVNISPTTTTFSPYTLNPAPLPVPPPSPFLTPYGYTQPSPTTSTSSCAGGSTPAEDGVLLHSQKQTIKNLTNQMKTKDKDHEDALARQNQQMTEMRQEHTEAIMAKDTKYNQLSYNYQKLQQERAKDKEEHSKQLASTRKTYETKLADADKAVKDERQMRVELQKQIDQLKSSKMANESSDKKFKDEAFSKVRALEEQIEEEKERRKNDVEKLTNANNELTTKLTAKRKKLVTIKGSKTNLEEELKKERDKRKEAEGKSKSLKEQLCSEQRKNTDLESRCQTLESECRSSESTIQELRIAEQARASEIKVNDDMLKQVKAEAKSEHDAQFKDFVAKFNQTMHKKQKELDDAIEEVKQSKSKMRDDDSLKEQLAAITTEINLLRQQQQQAKVNTQPQRPIASEHCEANSTIPLDDGQPASKHPRLDLPITTSTPTTSTSSLFLGNNPTNNVTANSSEGIRVMGTKACLNNFNADEMPTLQLQPQPIVEVEQHDVQQQQQSEANRPLSDDEIEIVFEVRPNLSATAVQTTIDTGIEIGRSPGAESTTSAVSYQTGILPPDLLASPPRPARNENTNVAASAHNLSRSSPTVCTQPQQQWQRRRQNSETVTPPDPQSSINRTEPRLPSNFTFNPSLDGLSPNELLKFIVAKSGGIKPAVEIVEQMISAGRHVPTSTSGNPVSDMVVGRQNANQQQTEQMTPNRASLVTGSAGSIGAMQFGTPTSTSPSQNNRSHSGAQTQTPTTPAPDTPSLSTSATTEIGMMEMFPHQQQAQTKTPQINPSVSGRGRGGRSRGGAAGQPQQRRARKRTSEQTAADRQQQQQQDAIDQMNAAAWQQLGGQMGQMPRQRQQKQTYFNNGLQQQQPQQIAVGNMTSCSASGVVYNGLGMGGQQQQANYGGGAELQFPGNSQPNLVQQQQQQAAFMQEQQQQQQFMGMQSAQQQQQFHAEQPRQLLYNRSREPQQQSQLQQLYQQFQQQQSLQFAPPTQTSSLSFAPQQQQNVAQFSATTIPSNTPFGSIAYSQDNSSALTAKQIKMQQLHIDQQHSAEQQQQNEEQLRQQQIARQRLIQMRQSQMEHQQQRQLLQQHGIAPSTSTVASQERQLYEQQQNLRSDQQAVQPQCFVGHTATTMPSTSHNMRHLQQFHATQETPQNLLQQQPPQQEQMSSSSSDGSSLVQQQQQSSSRSPLSSHAACASLITPGMHSNHQQKAHYVAEKFPLQRSAAQQPMQIEPESEYSHQQQTQTESSSLRPLSPFSPPQSKAVEDEERPASAASSSSSSSASSSGTNQLFGMIVSRLNAFIDSPRIATNSEWLSDSDPEQGAKRAVEHFLTSEDCCDLKDYSDEEKQLLFGALLPVALIRMKSLSQERQQPQS